jgi:integrase
MARRPGPRVAVYSMTERLDGKVTNPYRVRWKVGSRFIERTFPKKAAADRFRSRLMTAADDGERFDAATGLPIAWLTSDESFASFAHRWLHRDWKDRTPRGRASLVDDLIPIVCALVRPSAPSLADSKDAAATKRARAIRLSVRHWLQDPKGKMPQYLARYSLPLEDITRSTCETAQRRAFQTWAGTARAPEVQRGIRSTARSLFKAAMDEHLVTENPWPVARQGSQLQSQKVQQPADQTVRRQDLPTHAQVTEMLSKVVTHQPGSRNALTVLSLIYWAGLRPSEARVLRVEAVELPDTDDEWGVLHIEEADKSAGSAFTDDGEELGMTKTSLSRSVPAPPPLVAYLREAIGERIDGIIAATRNDTPITQSNLNRAFNRVRLRDSWTPYSLRQAMATTLLDSGVAPGEVARRLGHSIEVLLRHYAGVLSGSEDLANQRIEAHLAALEEK